jgi:hypothetical protein
LCAGTGLSLVAEGRVNGFIECLILETPAHV